MLPIDPVLADSLRHGLFACLVGGLALSTVWGVWLLIAPDAARRFADGADRWVSTENVVERLNRPIASGRLIYRYHRLVGGLITAGSGYCLIRWMTAYHRAAFISTLDHRLVTSGMDWIVAAGEWVFVIFNIAILGFGLVILFRPSLLKAPERFTDRWVRVPGDRVLDRRFSPLATALADHPRMLGVLVVVSCGFLLWRLSVSP